jgi:hypothetical protein
MVGAEFVVKFHVKLDASALPATSVMAVLSVAVYTVPDARSAVGVQVADEPLALTVPGTPLPASVTVKLDPVTVGGAIGLENVTWTLPVLETPDMPAAGTVETTVGGVVSDGDGDGPVLSESPQLATAATITPTWNSLPTRFRPLEELIMSRLL